MNVRNLIVVSASAVLFACASSNPNPGPTANDSRARANKGYGALDSEVGVGNAMDDQGQGGVSVREQRQRQAATAQAAPSLAQFANIQKPILMALPATNGDKSDPQSIVAANPFAKAAMEGVNEYLTSKGYEVRSLEGQNELDEVVQLQTEISGVEDLSYIASLMLGADVYIKFSGALRSDMITVELSAYETATARLLGSQTGSVKNNTGKSSNMRFLVHDAIKKAMPGLEEKILAYWAEDLKKGVLYKVVMNVSENYSENDVEDIQDNAVNSIRGKFTGIRVNAMTGRTVDIILYANPNDYADAFAVYSGIRSAVSSVANAKKNNISKKLIMLDLQ